MCAVNGVAAGAGANIALACDIVVAGRSAKFLQAFAKIALIPDLGGTWFLPRLAGDARARGMALLGEPISAETAERWGLIWKCVEDDALMDEAQGICEKFAKAPTGALAAIKQALDAAAGNSLNAQLDLERDVQYRLGLAHDYNEGVAAFMESAPPHSGVAADGRTFEVAADALARACAEAMWPDDNATNHLGMELFDVSAGRASMRLRVQPHMANGRHGPACHGDIFLLADFAFAYACNTYDHRTVAQQASIAFVASGKVGDVLTARAREVSKSGRSGIYYITVTREDGGVIAEFRGHSRVIKGHILPQKVDNDARHPARSHIVLPQPAGLSSPPFRPICSITTPISSTRNNMTIRISRVFFMRVVFNRVMPQAFDALRAPFAALAERNSA